jgi:dinuclear metal center YbgI/SA1388 family protein
VTRPTSSGDLAAYLDRFLATREIPDSPRALNGLQVENSGRLTRLMVAVDACQAAIDAAAKRGADFLIVHHGLFWGGLSPVTGRLARRLRMLMEHDIALYSAHIPLDCHPEVGNNAILADELGLESPQPFGLYEGVRIGFEGGLVMSLDALATRVGERLGARPHLIAKGPPVTRRVAVLTGAGSGAIREAHENGIDTLITGEGPHHSYFDAEEWGVNVIFAGHYATETLGVQGLGEHLRERFGIPFEFFDHPTGL